MNIDNRTDYLRISDILEASPTNEEKAESARNIKKQHVLLDILIKKKNSDYDFVDHNPQNMAKKSTWVVKDIFSFKKDKCSK